MATDGCNCTVVRVDLVLPEDGKPFSSVAMPCPAVASHALPLLDFVNDKSLPCLPVSAPAGFAMLAALFAWPGLIPSDSDETPPLLVQPLRKAGGARGGRSATAASASLGAVAEGAEDTDAMSLTEGGDADESLTDVGGEDAAALPVDGAEVAPSSLEIGARLGRGGTSIVYACADAAGAPVAAKMAMSASKAVTRLFDREVATLALRKLDAAASARLVPTVVGNLCRSSADGLGEPWRILLLRPRGVGLAQWLSQCLDAEPDAAAHPALRLRLATAVVLRLLEALEAVHKARRAHCDVRPSNIAIVLGSGGGGGEAMLIDFGIARTLGAHIEGCGVAAFTDERVFLAPEAGAGARARAGRTATQSLDVLGALLTWLALVFGTPPCDAPWAAASSRVSPLDDAHMYEGQRAWLAQHRACETAEPVVHRVIDEIHRLAALEPGAPADAAAVAAAKAALLGAV